MDPKEMSKRGVAARRKNRDRKIERCKMLLAEGRDDSYIRNDVGISAGTLKNYKQVIEEQNQSETEN